MHWIHNYLNKPWVAYARGPKEYDCWGLVLAVLSEQFGIADLPGFDEVTTDDTRQITQAFQQQAASGLWQLSPLPVDGAVVVCSIRGKNAELVVRHVGLYLNIDGGGVLHSRQGAGSGFDSVSCLKRLFPKVEFYARTNTRLA